jgi:ATP synthase protein I
MGPRITNQPIRAVLKWQLYATLTIALIAGLWTGRHGAGSALLGGAVSWVAGAVYGWLVSKGAQGSPAVALRALFRAEASKIVLIVIQLWIVLTAYRSVVLLWFFSAFLIATVIFSMAFFLDRPSTEQRT